MAQSFSNLREPRRARTHSVHDPLQVTYRTGILSHKIVLSPREAEQTQRNRLAFMGLTITGLVVIAFLSTFL